MDDENENLFDDDDALDYILYEECEKTDKKNGGSGCLGVLGVLLLPVAAFSGYILIRAGQLSM